MWCVFPIAIGAIDLPIRGCRSASAVHRVTVAGWAHVGKLRGKLVDVIEESSVLFARMIFSAIETFQPVVLRTKVLKKKKRVIKKQDFVGKIDTA